VDGNINGSYTTTTGRNQIWNHDVILNLNGKINSDIGYSGVVGYQARHDLYEESSIFSSNQVVFGVLNHFNFTTYSASQYKEAQNRLGAYASATFDYKNYLFLNLTGRNDWSNTIEKQNQSIFYPGASLSFVATDAFSFLNDSPLISFLKFRVGYGSSANFPGPYSTRSTLSLDSRRFVERTGEVVVTNAVSSRLGNPNLKPSRVNEIEVGVETKLWNNRIGLDLSLFKKSTKDLIIDQNLDPSTGYTVKRTNAGVLEVKGIELGYNASILKAGNFSWDISGNFVAQRSMTVSLPNGTDRIAIAGFTNLGNFAVPNKPYGVIMGSYIERNSEGQPIVNAEGEYVVSNNIKIIGNPNPDWTSAITNTFAYKNFRLSFEFQYTHGGDIYSRTAANLVGRGITTATDDVGRKTFVLPGVVKNADGSYSPNTTQITGTDMYFNVLGFGADELKVWDATTIRLNEVSLAYTLPKELISKTPFGSVSLTASGSNLWYKAINFPDAINFDPNVVGTGVGNGQGLDFLSGPSVRRYGISLRATF
jgi:outer membrane receptor protein involved in Fe transport